MPDDALYLFKAARRPSYLKENLNLLAAERGSIIEVAYNRMWVASQYFDSEAIERGTTAYFVFTERPYSLFVPARQAEVVESRWTELMLRLRVMLRSWVGVEDRDLADFTRLVQRTNGSLAPGNKFVVPKRDGIRLEPFFDDREDAGWQQTVENVLAMSRASDDDPYRASVFFRPADLRIGDELHVARREPLEPGTTATLQLRFHNPHLSDDDVSGCELRVQAPDDALEVCSPAEFPLTGEVEIPFIAKGGEPELLLQIGPVPAQHTSVVERFILRDHASRTDVPAPPRAGADGREILRLYESVWRNAAFRDTGDELDLIAEFERLLPGDQRIAERQGLLLAERGDRADAFRVLRDLNPELLGDDARFLLFRLMLDRDSDSNLVQQVESLNLTAEGRFDRFMKELEALDPRTLARLVPELAGSLPSDRLSDLMDHVGARLDSADALAETARNLYMNGMNARGAYDYLAERRRVLGLNQPVLVDALLDLAAAGGRGDTDPELAEDARHRIHNLIEGGKIEKARECLRTAGDALKREERNRLYHRIADRLDQRRQTNQAVHVMAELADAALRTGDLVDADEAIKRAHGLAASMNGTRPEWLQHATQRVESAWEACRDLVEWRKSADAQTRERLRERLLNRRVLIAGGLKRDGLAEHLSEMTGAMVDWAERYRAEGDDLGNYVERIRNGTYAVVLHVLPKSGHEVANRLKDACRDADVPFVAASSAGRRGLVEAAEKAVLEEIA